MFVIIQNSLKISTQTKILFIEKLKYIKHIIEDTSKSFDRLDQIEDSIWEDIGDITDLSQDNFEYYSTQIESLKNDNKNLPQILYKSLIVSIYSIIETAICDSRISIEKIFEKKIKFKHLKTVGSEIENTINFFELVHNLNFTPVQNHLKTLKIYSMIRNNIVHKNGDLNDENHERLKIIKHYVATSDSIEIIDNSLLSVNQKFVTDFLDFSQNFVLDYFDLISISYDNSQN